MSIFLMTICVHFMLIWYNYWNFSFNFNLYLFSFIGVDKEIRRLLKISVKNLKFSIVIDVAKFFFFYTMSNLWSKLKTVVFGEN